MSSSMKTNLELVKACDNFTYSDDHLASSYVLLLPNDDRPHGYMLPEIVQRMPWTPDFKVSHDAPRTVQLLDSSKGNNTSDVCNAAFATVVSNAIDRDLFKIIHRQHSEPFAILGANYPVRIERFASALFGIIGRGAHLTMYTRKPDGLKVWVPRRSAQVYTFPDMLDTTVAGGVRADESPYETIIHEADEEASLPADLLKRDVRSCGVLTYMTSASTGFDAETGLIVPDVIYIYDLEVSSDIVPKPHDDEVKEFYLWGVDEVKEALTCGEFKTNSAVVMIDFFIRHGIITPDNEKDYVEILTRMHRQLPFPTAPQMV